MGEESPTREGEKHQGLWGESKYWKELLDGGKLAGPGGPEGWPRELLGAGETGGQEMGVLEDTATYGGGFYGTGGATVGTGGTGRDATYWG